MDDALFAIPDIEENIALPANAADALPELSPVEELDMRVRTIKMLADLQGHDIRPDEQQQQQAIKVAEQMMKDPTFRPDYALYPNEAMAFLAGLVAQSNCMIVKDLAELKLYVINKLIHEIEHTDSGKIRVAALSKLGEIDGVDAFKKRTEVTHKIIPIEEVEQRLLHALDDIEYHVVEASPTPPETPEEGKNAEKTEIFAAEDVSEP